MHQENLQVILHVQDSYVQIAELLSCTYKILAVILYVQDSNSATLYVQDNILYVQGSRIAILYVQDNKFAILYEQGTILYVQDDHIFCEFFNACRFQSFVPMSSLAQ